MKTVSLNHLLDAAKAYERAAKNLEATTRRLFPPGTKLSVTLGRSSDFRRLHLRSGGQVTIQAIKMILENRIYASENQQAEIIRHGKDTSHIDVEIMTLRDILNAIEAYEMDEY